MEKSESTKELAAALNKVQAIIQAAKKDSVNPFFKSKYADLLSVWNACREALTTNGLSVTQIGDMDSEGRAVLETVLMHTSGEWIKGRLPLSTTKTDPQGQGSAITYARRYSLSAIVGLCTEEDDDAEGSMNREKTKKKEEKKALGSQHESSTPTGKKVQNIAELKSLLMKHKIGTHEAYEILSIKAFTDLVDLDKAWANIKKAKGIE